MAGPEVCTLSLFATSEIESLSSFVFKSDNIVEMMLKVTKARVDVDTIVTENCDRKL
jgi:hypothetical protein